MFMTLIMVYIGGRLSSVEEQPSEGGKTKMTLGARQNVNGGVGMSQLLRLRLYLHMSHPWCFLCQQSKTADPLWAQSSHGIAMPVRRMKL